MTKIVTIGYMIWGRFQIEAIVLGFNLGFTINEGKIRVSIWMKEN